jgi:hypothetical protein
VAAYALGSLGEEGAGGVAALRAAMVKETDSRVKLEMLAAFAPVGPAAVRELADKADDLLDALLDVAADIRPANRLLQNCAAISLYKMAPTSKQGAKALPIVARALMIKDILRTQGMLAPRTLSTNPTSIEGIIKQIELELHERAKAILVKGGKQAAEAVALTCNSLFLYELRDTTQLAYDKAYARKTAFEVLGALGPDANLPQVQTIFSRVSARWKQGKELPEVWQALKQARTAVNAKPKK